MEDGNKGPLAPQFAQVREALDRKHPGGFILEDRGDGLHWLRCIDCGREWAENDDGSPASGELECDAPALAVLSVIERHVQDMAVEMKRLLNGVPEDCGEDDCIECWPDRRARALIAALPASESPQAAAREKGTE